MRVIGLVLALGACTGNESVDRPTDETVDPWALNPGALGPWFAGFRVRDVTYEPVAGRSRTIPTNLWYPASEDIGEDVVYSGIAPDPLAYGHAEEAPPAWDGRYPVVVYSHGDQGFGGTSADLMRWFASHGWVAVAPDHIGNLLTANETPTPPAHWYERPRDISAVLDALEDLPPTDPLAGLVDTSRVLMVGHSRGTYTVWAVAGATYVPEAVVETCDGQCTAAELELFQHLADPRVVAALPMAGTIRRSWFGPTGHQSVSGPVMSMTGSSDEVGQQEQWDSMDGIDFTWLDLDGGCHQTFALGVCATLDVDEGFRIVDTYAMAFARAHVLGDDDPGVTGILDGSIPVSTEVTFQRKGP